MRPLLIAPSILAADFAKLGDEVRAVDAGRRRLDPSRCDGRAFRAEYFLRPGRHPGDAPAQQEGVRHPPDDRAVRPYLEAFAKAGSDIITVHVEAGPHVHRSLQAIRALGKKAGVTLNPGTPIETIENVIDLVDLILVMSVNPGFGGQAFIASAVDKIARARALAGAAADRHRGRWRDHARDRARGRARRRERAGRGLRGVQGRRRRLRQKHRGDPQRRRAGARGSGVTFFIPPLTGR